MPRPDGDIKIRTKSAVVQSVGKYFVFVHSNEDPSDREWDQLIQVYRKASDPKDIRSLVFTEGGSPNARQRVSLNQLFGATKPVIALITASALARAAGTAISWFNPRVRMFSPEEVERALDHLGATQAERPELVSALKELRAALREPAEES